ncbi:MAG: hypothetical protein A4E39_01428 [Methanoregulaceae archaeon PtaB.Bin152]|nr:MAG: hypothetical protein A4E39_01428 [Methanoregulaceae archaeon PtaB.Bin152]
MSLGRHMHVEKSLSPFSHTLRVLVTGERIPVQVNPAFRDLFLWGTPPAYETGWCPFLRKEGDGTFVCTIYSSRPVICRTFRCCTMRILDEAGSEVGKVKGKSSLSTADPVLRQIWEREVLPSSTLPEAQFARHCRTVLASHGYTCEQFDS